MFEAIRSEVSARFACAICCLIPLAHAAVAAPNSQAEELYNTAHNHNTSNPDLALDAISKAVTLDPKNFKYLKERGKILLWMDEYPEALKSFDAARGLNAKDSDLLRNRAECLRLMKRWPEAVSDIHAAIKLNDKDPDIFQTEARIYLHMSQFDQADAAIKKCLKIVPTNLAVQNDEMKILQAAKKWKELIEFITTCLQQKSNKSGDVMEFMYRRAKAYEELKEYDKAIADFKTMARKAPDARQPHAGLLAIYTATAKTDEARREKSWLEEYDSDIVPTK